MNPPDVRTVRGPFAFVARVSVLLLALVILAPLTQPAGASTRSNFLAAKQRLHQLEREITTAQSRLRYVKRAIARQVSKLSALQSELNKLAARLTDATARWQQTRTTIRDTQRSLAAARARYRKLRRRIDRRARYMYEQGPGGTVEFLFGATSLADLTDRVELVNALQSQDADLSVQTQNVAASLRMKAHQ